MDTSTQASSMSKRSRNRANRTLLLSMLILSLTASATQGFQQLTTDGSSPKKPTLTDVIRYRTLHIDDFKAVEIPTHLGADARHPLATARTYVLSDLDTVSQSFVTSVGSTTVYASFVTRIEYYALMDRGASWWNVGAEDDAAYVLSHEQIHFAIAELVARQLTRALEGLMVSGDSRQQASENLSRKLRETTDAHFQLLLSRNAAFDRDTSGGYNRLEQSRWRKQIEHELTEFN